MRFLILFCFIMLLALKAFSGEMDIGDYLAQKMQASIAATTGNADLFIELKKAEKALESMPLPSLLYKKYLENVRSNLEAFRGVDSDKNLAKIQFEDPPNKRQAHKNELEEDLAKVKDQKIVEALSFFFQITHNRRVYSMAFSPDGKYLVTGCYDGTVQIWKVEDRSKVGKVLHHRNGIRSVVFSPDGKYVGTASFDHTAQVWKVEDGSKVGPALQHNSWVNLIAFSSDGKYVGTASSDGSAKIYKIHYYGDKE